MWVSPFLSPPPQNLFADDFEFQPDYAIGMWKGCPNELTTQLGIQLCLNAILWAVFSIVLPIVTFHFKRFLLWRGKMERRAGGSKILWTCRNARWILRYLRYDTSKDIEQHEMEAALDPPELIDEQLDVVIQMGFVTLFAASFPLAALIALAVDLLSVRITALVWLKYKSKIDYEGASGLGIHYTLLQLVSILAVVNNFLLIGFSYAPVKDLFTRIRPDDKYQAYYLTTLTIFGLEHVMLVTKWLIGQLLPSVPEKVRILRAKNEYVRAETIKKATGEGNSARLRRKQAIAIEQITTREKHAILSLVGDSSPGTDPSPATFEVSGPGTSSSV